MVIMVMVMMMIMVMLIIMVMIVMMTTKMSMMISTYLRSSSSFAKKILTAQKEGKVEELKVRSKRRTAVSETVWVRRMAEWLELPEHVRTQPGVAKVSVAYGVRREIFWLLKPKKQLAEELRAKYRAEGEERLPCVSTLLTLIPSNYRRPREQDRLRNVCVKHSNLTHMVRKLRPLLPDLPTSSAELSGLAMCAPSPANMFTLASPLTWRRECALRSCSSCPTAVPPGPWVAPCPAWVPTTLTAEQLAMPLSIPQWGQAMDLRKGKEVHCLHSEHFTVASALDELEKQLKVIPTHLFKMATQFEGFARAKASLKLHELNTEEDYQVRTRD